VGATGGVPAGGSTRALYRLRHGWGYGHFFITCLKIILKIW